MSLLPFLDVHVQDFGRSVSLTGVCAGYESGEWRAKELAFHALRFLQEFALTRDEWGGVNPQTSLDFLVKAADEVYKTNKYEARGELGELLLHMILRQHYQSEPIVSKIYFKSATNDTVKGFDAVHFVPRNNEIELWLGEVKFYTNISAAIRDVCKELKDHTERDYLRSEFMWIENKIPSALPNADKIKTMLNKNTSLDKIFPCIHIPVLLTYKSKAVCSSKISDKTYIDEIKKEFEKYYNDFSSKTLPNNVKIHLCLLPLKAKAVLLKTFDEKLKALQIIGA